MLGITIERTQGLGIADRGAEKEPLPILTVIAHHPTYFPAFVDWATVVALEGVLPRRQQEILALRVAANCRSDFEWGHHVAFGRNAGITEDEIDVIASERLDATALSSWSAADRALVETADELWNGCEVSDETWATLRAHFDDAQLSEIPFVVGQYTMLSMFANMLGVALEPGYEPAPRGGVRQPAR